ncbi:MAG: hypothetical protein ACWA5U_02285 [bacterium]
MFIIPILLFSTLALLMGVGLGWWLGRTTTPQQTAVQHSEYEQLQYDLQQAKRDIQLLKVEKQQATEKIDTYARHFNSDLYGDYLKLREQLTQCQVELNTQQQAQTPYLDNRLHQVA